MAKQAIVNRDDQSHSYLVACIRKKLSYYPENPRNLIHSVTDKFAKTMLLSVNNWACKTTGDIF